jgi:DNA-binding NarL/FixJ family response regulator
LVHTLHHSKEARRCGSSENGKSRTEGLARLDPPPDRLVLDLGLPDGDGEAILRRVRAERLPIRIIVHTGMVDPARLSAVSSMRPDAVLPKPLDSEGLRTICGMEMTE